MLLFSFFSDDDDVDFFGGEIQELHIQNKFNLFVIKRESSVMS